MKEKAHLIYPSLLVIGAFLTYLALILSSFHGFDVTDEAYYFLKINYPSRDLNGITSFGELLYPLSKLFTGLISLRVFGIFLILFSTIAVSYEFLKALESRLDFVFRHNEKFCIILFNVICATTYYSSHGLLLTPSYNTLAFVGGLIFLFGSLKLINHPILLHPMSLAKIVLPLNIGSFLLFIARVPGAIFISFVAFLFSFTLTKPKRYYVFLAYVVLGVIFVLSFIFIFQPDFQTYISRLKHGMFLITALKSGHSLETLMTRAVRDIGKALNPLGIVVRNYPAVLGLVLIQLRLFGKVLTSERVLFANLLFVVSKVFLHKASVELIQISIDQILLLAVVYWLEYRRERPSTFWKVFLLSLFFIFIAIATKVGTNNSIIKALHGSFIFFAMILVILSHRIVRTEWLLRAYLLTWVLFLSYLQFQAIKMPYRQIHPLWTNRSHLSIAGSDLYVDESLQKWGNELRTLAKKAQWENNTSLIDLTGSTPGAAVLLEAKTPGAPWLIGGYPGSTDVVKYALKNSSCKEVTSSWMLTTIDGRRRLPPEEILAEVGRKFPDDYEKIGDVEFEGFKKEIQTLWKPKRNLQDECAGLKRNSK